MKNTRRTNGPVPRVMTWHDLTRRLAQHINSLHQTVARTGTPLEQIERWRKNLDALPGAETATGAQRGGQR